MKQVSLSAWLLVAAALAAPGGTGSDCLADTVEHAEKQDLPPRDTESAAARMPKAMRDPTLSPSDVDRLNAPPPAKAPPPPIFARRAPRVQDTVSVQAIITVDGKRTAIVNDMSVSEGDRLGKITVLRIEADRVVFRSGDKTFSKALER